MLNLILIVVLVIALTIGLVWVIDKYISKKLKPVILLVLWIIIGVLAYMTFMSVYGEMKFNKLKEERYKVVIENLKDIRDSQLAHRTVTGKFSDNWDGLVRFIDTAKFTITQRRDTTVLDEEATRRFGGVETFKEMVLIDTLGFVPVKDSLFGADKRYEKMMYYPVGQTDKKFELKAGQLDQNGIMIPVFEVKALKDIILFDQDKNLVAKEKEVVSVDGVNGDAVRVGSMDEVNTNGNWPKNYSTEQ